MHTHAFTVATQTSRLTTFNASDHTITIPTKKSKENPPFTIQSLIFLILFLDYLQAMKYVNQRLRERSLKICENATSKFENLNKVQDHSV